MTKSKKVKIWWGYKALYFVLPFTLLLFSIWIFLIGAISSQVLLFSILGYLVVGYVGLNAYLALRKIIYKNSQE